MDCVFCKIINGEIPSKTVYENDSVLAFHDINPGAPVHVLVVPKQHIRSIDHVDEGNVDAVKEIMLAIPKIANELGLDEGYRVITNIGQHGGQSVHHLHFHILGGEQLKMTLV